MAWFDTGHRHIGLGALYLRTPTTGAIKGGWDLFEMQVRMYGTQGEVGSTRKVIEFAKRNEHTDMRNEMYVLMRSIRDSMRKDLNLPTVM